MAHLHEVIVDVLGDDEEPLGVAYHEVEKRLGREVHAREFLDAINHMLENDVIRLWETDVRSGDRSEVFLLTEDRGLPYLDEMGCGGDVGPAVLTLARGSLARVAAAPAWRVQVNMKQRRFVLETDVETEAEAIQRMHDTNPEVRFRIARRVLVGKRVRIKGSAVPKDAHESADP